MSHQLFWAFASIRGLAAGLALLTLIDSASKAEGVTYYVDSVRGQDSSSGTSSSFGLADAGCEDRWQTGHARAGNAKRRHVRLLAMPVRLRSLSCNPNSAYYSENLYSPDETPTYSLNVDYDSGAASRIVQAGVQTEAAMQ